MYPGHCPDRPRRSARPSPCDSGTLISRISSVMAIAKTPSLKASSRAVDDPSPCAFRPCSYSFTRDKIPRPETTIMTATIHEPRVIRAPRGTSLSCRGWQQEAALRMLMNNLDPEVADRPEQLIVYGGI